MYLVRTRFVLWFVLSPYPGSYLVRTRFVLWFVPWFVLSPYFSLCLIYLFKLLFILVFCVI